jgi:tRNA-modifying protein YgfZ
MHEDLLRGSRPLPHFGTLRLSGPDARTFLQGQLSADLLTLTPTSVLLASCNSAQGRVQSILWILERGEELVLLTSAELIEAVLARLKKYVLRAKVKFEAPTLAVFGSIGPPTNAAAWTAPLAQEQANNINVVRWPGDRLLLIAPVREAETDQQFVNDWRLQDIAAGIPQVHAETQESFVAQMLNLDLLAGISFEKGCYTGQEIIARTHYRGTVKRRMFRYAADGAPPAAGTRVLAGEEPAGEIVTAAATPTGSELLAVIQLSYLQHELRLDSTSKPALRRLPLPYAIKEDL